jgi:telomerase reverse transcriptase
MSRPEHLLCQGFERASADNTMNCGIPGIARQIPNSHVEMLTSSNWCHLLRALGKGGDAIMADLVLDCAIFEPTNSSDPGRGNLYQLSGMLVLLLWRIGSYSMRLGLPLSTTARTVKAPKSEILDSQERPKPSIAARPKGKDKHKHTLLTPRTPSEIRFVRNRIFYGRPKLNSKGKVRLGLRHIHVFNRFTNINSLEETLHILKYIFPRQYGLHNVFTSVVDSRETTQPFKDYTLREQEIEDKRKSDKSFAKQKIPKRLRGGSTELVEAIRKAHSKIAYIELLRHYCPLPVSIIRISANLVRSLGVGLSHAR